MTRARDVANIDGILTAKGDIYAATAAATPDRLAVGNNGDTLVADSAATTGLRWQSSFNGNGIINGGFDIWQRGTSFTPSASTTTYTADRWAAYRNTANYTISRQTSSLTGIQYSLRAQRNSGNTDLSTIFMNYSMETADSYRFAGQTVTISFWAKCGANYSSSSSALRVDASQGTGTDQNIISGFTGGSGIGSSQTLTLTSSWQRFTFSGSVNSASTQIGLQFYYTPTGTASTNDWFEITGVQVEFGSVATAFKRAGGTIQGELAACQRYYSKSYPQTVAPATSGNANGMIGFSNTSTANQQIYGNVKLPVTMRTQPTITMYSFNGANGVISRVVDGGDQAAASAFPIHIGWDEFNVQNNSGGTVSTASGAIVHYVASAEL